MTDIVHASYRDDLNTGSISQTSADALSGGVGGTNIYGAVGAFTGTAGLPLTPLTTLAGFTAFANALQAKVTEVSDVGITVTVTSAAFVGVGGNGNDTFTVKPAISATIFGGGGNDTFSLLGVTPGTLALAPGTLNGGSGNDVFNVGFGSDILTGGPGSDIFKGPLGALNTDRITDFSIADKIVFTGVSLAAYRFQLQASGPDTLLKIDGDSNGSFETTITLNGAISGQISAVQSAGNTTFTINVAPDAVDDSATVNKFASVVGNVITGNAAGGADIDANGDPTSVVNIAGGTVGLALAGSQGTLTLNADGSYSYLANNAEPLAVGATIQDIFSYTLSDGIAYDNATLTITVVGVATGNAANNQLLGNAAANTLRGLGGHDSLDGAAGNDTLDGGVGNDTLRGGTQNDILIGGAGADTQEGGTGNDTFRISGIDGANDSFDGGAGIDRIHVIGATAVTLSGFSRPDSIEQWVGNGKGVLGTAKANILDFSSLQHAVGWTSVNGGAGNDEIAGSKFAETLLGGAGNDTLQGGAGNDTLNGGDGGDILAGGLGRDVLIGGKHRDLFDFNAVAESKVGAGHDVIKAFQRGVDDIDLTGIDANTALAGNNAFKFIGTAAFSHVRGELHYIDKGATCLVQGDVNGDGKADFEILVEAAALAAGDFLL